MARMLTEEEVEKLEQQRELQRRADAATDPNALYNQRMAAAHAAAMERQRGYIERNPNAETNTALRHQVMRDAELRAAHERQKDIMGTEDVTQVEVARQKRMGMENQGVGAATIRAQADKDILGQNLADKEKQRQHELAMLGQTQTFQGTQADAERRNRLDIADVQAEAQENTARIQAQAQNTRMYAENMMKQRQVDENSAMKFAEKRSQMISQLIGATKDKRTGRPRYTEEEAAKIIDARLEGQLPGTERRLDSWRR